jgi:NADP-dependent 3-hydroxy acid dehydrogenase YdfG
VSPTDRPLHGRTAVVTGASSGIGLATAQKLTALGARTVALARRAAPPAAGEARTADVTDPAAVREALGDLDGIDVLVVAAGTNVTRRRLDELSAEGIRDLLDVNLAGVIHVVTAALPALRRARGLVIVVGSVSGSWPDRSGPAYQAAKAGALAFARGAGLEEHDRGSGVRFSVVQPGMVDTPLIDRRPEPPPPEQRAQMLQPGDVADVCAFLACLPGRAHVPELTVLPSALQAVGRTA